MFLLLKNTFSFLFTDVISLSQETEEMTRIAFETDISSLFLGIFFGLMIAMAIYNLILYFSLRDRAYLLYVGSTVFAILTTISTNNLGDQFLWPSSPNLDGIIYITFAGICMFFSSRFAAVFLELEKRHQNLNKLLWVIAYLSLLLSALSLFLTIEQITPFGRWLVLFTFPTYIIVAAIAYKNGFQLAKYYLIAWIPYALGLIIRTMHGAGWLPGNQFVLSSIELGGALETMLLSLALAYRIKKMQEENTQIRAQLKTYISQVISLEEKIKSSETQNSDEHSLEEKIKKLVTDFDLTDREADVLLQLAKGSNNQQIADELFISINTVKYHIRNLYEKLDVKKRTEITPKLLFDK
jgi:DNA-binding CsgD family transcriptional regulator